MDAYHLLPTLRAKDGSDRALTLLTLGTEFNVRKAQLGHDRGRKVSNIIQTINRASSSLNSRTFSEFP